MGKTRRINCFSGTESLADTIKTLLLFSLKPFTSSWRDSRSQPHTQGMGLSQQIPRAVLQHGQLHLKGQDQIWHPAHSSPAVTASHIPPGSQQCAKKDSSIPGQNKQARFNEHFCNTLRQGESIHPHCSPLGSMLPNHFKASIHPQTLPTEDSSDP